VTKRSGRARLDTSDAQSMLSVIESAAAQGNTEAQSWLNGEGYIHITDEPHQAVFVCFNNQYGRFSKEARYWRESVFKRDDYICVECGGQGNLHAHHLMEWAKEPSQRFNIDNGVTLCVECHSKKHPSHQNLIKRAKYNRREVQYET